MDVFTNNYRFKKEPGVKRRSLPEYLLASFDVVAVLLAFQTSYLISYFEQGGFFFSEKNILILFASILPFWIFVHFLVRSTGIVTKRYKVLSLLYLQSSIAIFFLLTLFCFLFGLYPLHRFLTFDLAVTGFIFFYFGRILLYKILRRFGEKVHNNVIVIIFADDASLSFIDNLISNAELGYKAVVIFTDSVLIKARFENSSIILPEKFSGIIRDLIEVDFVDEVLYLKEKHDAAAVREIIGVCEDTGVTFRLKYSAQKANLSSAVRTDIADGKFLSFINIPNNSFALAIKKTTDINIALLMIVVLSPVFVLFGFLVKITSKGPVITKQSKVGWKGRQIKVYRFRTMYADSEKTTVYSISGQNQGIKGSEYEEDPRITLFGKFLLKSGLDQLPQLFNVLKGEMSIIGPQHPLQSENVKSFNRKFS